MKRFMALLLTGAVFLAGCGGSAPAGGGKGTVNVTIATMSPLSGPNADLGASIRFGTELAINDRAADLEKAGLKVSFLPMDDQGKPEQGTQLAEQLITKKEVLAVVGTLNSGVAIPVSQKLAPENLVMVSPANTATQVTDRKLPNMNRINARDDMQGPAAAKYIQNDLKAKSVFIIHDKTPYGQGLAEEVRKAATAGGLKVDAFEGIGVGEKDFSAVITKVSGAKSEVIFFGGMYGEAAQILKQMKEKNVSAKFIGADGLDSGDLVKLAGDAANGVYFTSVAADPMKTKAGQEWSKRYAEFAKKPADGFAAYGYDAAQVVIEAFLAYAKANPGKTPTRKDISEQVRKTTNLKGIASTVTFDEKGDNKQAEVFVFQIQNGKYPGVQVK